MSKLKTGVKSPEDFFVYCLAPETYSAVYLPHPEQVNLCSLFVILKFENIQLFEFICSGNRSMFRVTAFLVQNQKPEPKYNLSAQIICPSPKVWDFDEKRLHWASVVRDCYYTSLFLNSL